MTTPVPTIRAAQNPIEPSNDKPFLFDHTLKSSLKSIAFKQALKEPTTRQFSQNIYFYMLAQVLHRLLNNQPSDETGYIRVAFDASKPSFFLYPSFWMAFHRHLKLGKIEKIKAFIAYIFLFLPLKIFIPLGIKKVISSFLDTTKKERRLFDFLQQSLSKTSAFIEKYSSILAILARHRKTSLSQLTKELAPLLKNHIPQVTIAQKYASLSWRFWMPTNRLAKMFKGFLAVFTFPVHLLVMIFLKAYEAIINRLIRSIFEIKIPSIIKFIKTFDYETLRDKTHVMAFNRFVCQASFSSHLKDLKNPQNLKDAIKVFSDTIFKFYTHLNENHFSSKIPFSDKILEAVIENSLKDVSLILLEEKNPEQLLQDFMDSFNSAIVENYSRDSNQRDQVASRLQHQILDISAKLIKRHLSSSFINKNTVMAISSLFGILIQRQLPFTFLSLKKVQYIPSFFYGATVGGLCGFGIFKTYDFAMIQACQHVVKKIFNVDLS